MVSETKASIQNTCNIISSKNILCATLYVTENSIYKNIDIGVHVHISLMGWTA